MDQKPADVWGPDNYPSVEDQPLGPEELQVRAHWQQFLPNMVAELKAQGPRALDTAVRKAWWLTEYHVLLAQAQNPKLHELQARDLFRNQWLWLPPEKET
jgi:hypothetical protein